MYNINIFENHFKAVFPELFLAMAATIILVHGAVHNPSASYKFAATAAWLSLQTLLITVLLIANGWSSNVWRRLGDHQRGLGESLGMVAPLGDVSPSGEMGVLSIFGGALIVDDFTSVIKILIALSAFSSILLALRYMQYQRLNSYEYVVLTIFSVLSMLLVTSSYDLISMYLAIELQSLSFYVLAASRRDNEFSTEAGLKYFVLGALSSGLLLFGESIIYGFTGITNFEELAKLNLGCGRFADVPPSLDASFAGIQGGPSATWPVGNANGPSAIRSAGSGLADVGFADATTMAALGLLFMLVAFLFKISAVPFHMWTPDVYEGAPTSVTAFFAIAPKVALLALLSRLLMDTFYDLIDSWGLIIAVCSLLSMFVGTWGALNQNKLKRLVAYSSIAHVGYLLVALATSTTEAVESLLVYIVIYVIGTINTFGILLVMSKNHSWLARARPSHIQVAPEASLACASTPTPLDGPMVPSSERGLAPLVRGAQGHLAPPAVGFSSSPTTYKWLPNASFAGTSGGNLPRDPRGLLVVPSHHDAPRRGAEVGAWSKEVLRAALPTWNSFAFASELRCPPPQGGGDARFAGLGDATRRGAPAGLARIKKKDVCIKYITDFSMLSKTNPVLAVTAAITFFSNAGVPPLAGFYGKLNVFLAAMEASMYVLAIAGILCSVMGAFYSIRLVKIIYFHSMSPSKQRHWTPYRQVGKENSLLLAFTWFFTLFFFLYPSFLFTIAHFMALSLCQC